ncbi:MFS transporter [Streptomyces sp. 5-8]|uniref:MFS transporter n=1 Tax=Streptomyces musisoli TaxID=2802280 RepID=A0ABS1P778_9ACTN|nr:MULTISPECIES: MFS transporter [Streptomyces]MBL1107771.1 MFS transporter [Streptomyces musisoli]MBY8843030.1 MFS transporter [Streptomyces sp. SP2-10]
MSSLRSPGTARQAPPAEVAGPAPAAAFPRVATVVVLGTIMAVLDMTIVNVALRHLSESFGAPLETMQWTTTAYTLALAAVIPTAAWAMDRIGAKRTYVIALALFTLGSLLAACAWDAGSLIAFRAVQGLGGGLLQPVGMTMGMRVVDRARLGRAMAVLGLPILVGPVLGPVLGGRLVDAASWHWIFLINLPVGALALLLAARLLPADAPAARGTEPPADAPHPYGTEPPADAPHARGTGRPRLDVPGLLMLSPGLALLLYGLARGGERGDFTAPGTLVPTLAGAVLAAAFVRRALAVRAPLLDLRLLRDRTFAAGIGTLAVFTCGYFGSMLLGPLYWQQERGLSATAAGLLGAPVGLVVGTTMQIAARRIDRVAPRRMIAAGCAVGALGMGLLAWQTGMAGVASWRIVVAGMVLGVGAGMTMMPAMTTATRDLPADRLAGASTALSINSQLAASVGTALLSVVLGTAGPGPAGFRLAYAVAAALLALGALSALRLPARRAG